MRADWGRWRENWETSPSPGHLGGGAGKEDALNVFAANVYSHQPAPTVGLNGSVLNRKKAWMKGWYYFKSANL